MQGKADVLDGGRIQKQRQARYVRAGGGAEKLEVSAHEVAQPCALPVLLDHEVLGLGETLEAPVDPFGEFVDVLALASRLQGHSSDHRKLVLGTVCEFAHQKCG